MRTIGISNGGQCHARNVSAIPSQRSRDYGNANAMTLNTTIDTYKLLPHLGNWWWVV